MALTWITDVPAPDKGRSDVAGFFFFEKTADLHQKKQNLTYLRHLRHSGEVGPVQEPGLVVIDVLDLDNELGLGLQWPVCLPVAGLGSEDVLRLNLAVQPLDGMDVACAVINGEGGSGALTRQDVPDGAVAFVHVRVELQSGEKSWDVTWCCLKVAVLLRKLNDSNSSDQWKFSPTLCL